MHVVSNYELCNNKKIYIKNGTNSRRIVGNVRCKLFGDSNRRGTTISNDNHGRVHAWCQDGNIYGGLGGKSHLLISFALERYQVKGRKFQWKRK